MRVIGGVGCCDSRLRVDPVGPADPALRGGAQEGGDPGPGTGLTHGLVTSASNPKLAVFFVVLFPQFLTRASPVLPCALGMAAVIVVLEVLEVLWFSTLALAVDRARTMLKPRVQRGKERFTGAVMVGLGLRLATESR